MSLLNLIVHPERAYVVTDSGYYGEGGVVSRLHPKSMVLRDLGLVIASAGRLHCGHLAVVMSGLDKLLSQEAFVRELPHIAKEAVETYKIDRRSVVTFAGYSPDQGRAFGGVFAAADDPRAYRISSRSVFLSPGHPSIDEATLAQPSTFDPLFDFMPLIEQQRGHNFGSPEDPICGIAGDIDVVSVSRDGVKVRTIYSYPAKVGEKVSIDFESPARILFGGHRRAAA